MRYCVWGGLITIGLMFVVLSVPEELKIYVLGLQIASVLAQGVSLVLLVMETRRI